MLFDIIRDFFVEHVFGGYKSSGGAVYCKLGSGRFLGTPSNSVYSIDLPIDIGNSNALCLGDWLSTTATIITLVGIVVCAFLFIRWIFKVCSNSILLR